MDDQQIRDYKVQLGRLREAYSELLQVFTECNHYTANKSVHEALWHVNRAILALEEA